jgi:hypothetical protein
LCLKTIGANVQSGAIVWVSLAAFRDAVIAKNHHTLTVPPGSEPDYPKFLKK